MDMNVFRRGYYPWKYPSNWGRNIKYFFRSFKYGWQRATRGYADSDIWNLDAHLLGVLSGTLRALADNHWGWPGNTTFPTDEEWTQFLTDMSDKFYRAEEENEFYPHPEQDKWWKWIETHSDNINVDENPFVSSMLEEEHQIQEKRMRDFAEAWSAIGEHFFSLWD